jgi:hypothetical protein
MTARTLPTPARLAASLAAAVALALGLLLGLVPGLGGSPAGAHDGPAIVVIEQVHPAGLQMHYIVRVTWEDDGHPAEDATVTATAIAADGTQLTPVALAPADDDGRYAGVVEYPSAGTWTVRVTSIEPTGSVERPQEVTAPATTELQDDSEVTTAPDESGEDDEGFAPADDGTGDSDEAATGAPAGSDDSDDSGMPAYLLVAAAAVVVIGAVTAVNIIRRNRPSGTAGVSADGPTHGGGDGAGESISAGDGSPTAGGAAHRGGDGTPAAGSTPAGDVTSTSPSS